jgi:hypothetical protein
VRRTVVVSITILSSIIAITLQKSRNSSVGIATGWVLDGPGFIADGARDFCLLHSVLTGSGFHPASYAMGTGDCFLGIKWLGREAEHSFPLSAYVKHGGAVPPLPHAFMSYKGKKVKLSLCLTKH